MNIAYPLPNGETVKYLDDKEIYLGNQINCEFGDEETDRCIGIVTNADFILISEYGPNGSDPELLLYKKR